MYTLEDPRSVSLHPVEGMRNNWQNSLVGNYDLLTKEQKQGYLLALQILSNSFLPAAYLRSEPVARLEMNLNSIVADCKYGKIVDNS